jgi:chromosome segregation ATPase
MDIQANQFAQLRQAMEAQAQQYQAAVQAAQAQQQSSAEQLAQLQAGHKQAMEAQAQQYQAAVQAAQQTSADQLAQQQSATKAATDLVQQLSQQVTDLTKPQQELMRRLEQCNASSAASKIVLFNPTAAVTASGAAVSPSVRPAVSQPVIPLSDGWVEIPLPSKK